MVQYLVMSSALYLHFLSNISDETHWKFILLYNAKLFNGKLLHIFEQLPSVHLVSLTSLLLNAFKMKPLEGILKLSLLDSTEQTGEAMDMNDVKEALPKVSETYCMTTWAP